MSMISLKRTPAAKKKATADAKVESVEQETWPYGLSLRFERPEIQKLKVLAGVKPKDRLTLQATARVTEVVNRDDEDPPNDSSQTVAIQIEQIEIAKDAAKEFSAGFEGKDT